MSSQLLINVPTSFAKFNTLLPLCPIDTKKIERDLITKLDRDLFSNARGTDINSTTTTFIPTNTRQLPTSYSQYIKSTTDTIVADPSCAQSYLPSPPRSPRSFTMTSPTMRSSMVTPPPEPAEIRSSEVITVASKIPLFRRRKINYINKEVVSAENGPVVLKLCNINYPTTPLNSAPRQCMQPLTTISSASAPTQSNVPFTITIPSTKQRKFLCKTCSMAFTTSGHLSRHNRIHTGERNYTCPYEGCKQRFSRHDNCLQHYRTHLKKQQRRKRK